MSSISVRPATVADKDAISHVHYEALKHFHDFYAAFFKIHPKKILPIATERALNKPELEFLVAEEGSSAVGFIRFGKIGAKTGKEAEESGSGNDKMKKQQALPPLWDPKDHLKELWKRFNERQAEMDACQENAIGEESHYFVYHLMVHPDHQRKGIGRMLLQRVIDKADADSVSTLIVSSLESHHLYTKMGFEDLGTWTIDNEYWAGEITAHERTLKIEGNEDLAQRFEGVSEVEACMIRKPRNGDV